MTPFRALYGCDPPPLVRYGLSLSPVAIVDQQLADRDATLDLLKQQLQRAQQKMKMWAGGSRLDVSFEVGDLVYLNLHPYRQRLLVQRCNEKLAPRFYDPFEVLTRVG